MRPLAIENWGGRRRQVGCPKKQFGHFARTNFRESALPEGFCTLEDLLAIDDVAPTPEDLALARSNLSQERKVKGLAGLRMQLGVSQTALAKKIGTSQPRLSTWEKGSEQPNLSNIEKLKDALEVSYDDLIRALLNV